MTPTVGTKWIFFSPPLTWLMSRIFYGWPIPAVLSLWLHCSVFLWSLLLLFFWRGEFFPGSSFSNLRPSLLLIFWGLALRLIIFSHFSHIFPNGSHNICGLRCHLYAGDSHTCPLSCGLPYPAFPLIPPSDVSEALQTQNVQIQMLDLLSQPTINFVFDESGT